MDTEKVLSIARLRPVQPLDAARALDIDSMMAGAILSDFVAKKKLKVSNIKVGSSPLYYLPGSESQLLNFLNYLNSKDKETADLLKEKKVIRAANESPLVRVSLSNIKDFAVPLEVIKDNNKELFYKWFLLNDSEAAELIKTFFNEENVVKQEEKKEKSKVAVEKVEEQKLKKEPVPKIKKIAKQETLVKKENLSTSMSKFFQDNNISVVEIIKKRGKEVEQIIKVPTLLGRVVFYCKFLTKAKITDADINSILVNAQLRKLPGVLLYSGELTNKAKDLSNKISDVIIKRI